jgi:hypothetical protein
VSTLYQRYWLAEQGVEEVEQDIGEAAGEILGKAYDEVRGVDVDSEQQMLSVALLYPVTDLSTFRVLAKRTGFLRIYLHCAEQRWFGHMSADGAMTWSGGSR